MKNSDLIRALKGVPEFRLRLIELARELVGEDGSIDFEKAAFYRQETEDAIKEAQGYAQVTKEAVQCLRQIAR
jgi:hypothetical protein